MSYGCYIYNLYPQILTSLVSFSSTQFMLILPSRNNSTGSLCIVDNLLKTQ